MECGALRPSHLWPRRTSIPLTAAVEIVLHVGAVDATGYTVAQIRERASVAAPAEMSAAGIDIAVSILERSPLSN